MIKAVLFDDEYIVLEALGALVDWRGLGIELAGTAGDGLSALAMFRSVRPEIVLTDIRMPGKDGLQLVEEIMEEAPDTCCIVFSGFNEFEYVKRAIGLGVADYVEKPITEQSIERALRKVLGQIGRKEEIRTLERKWEAVKGNLSEWFWTRIEADANNDADAQERTKHAAVEKARLYIEQNFARDITLQETAEHVGLNATYFSILFKEVIGEAYIKYLTRCRMEFAKTLLRKGFKVNEVSERVGYLTHRHFSEVFKKYTGMTPGQFRDS